MANERKPRAKKEPDVPEAPPEPPPVDAVIVVRTPDDEGNIAWGVGELLGNVTPDQVPTGLRLAANDVEKRLGIAG